MFRPHPVVTGREICARIIKNGVSMLHNRFPPEAWDAFHQLVAMGFDKQLAK